MATARNGRELFTILETSADTESGSACGGQDSPLNLSADVKWFEIPYRKPDSDEDDGVREEEEEEEEDDGGGGGGGGGGEGENGFPAAAAAEAAADAASFIAGGGCNIILVTGSNGVKHDEDEYAEDCYYSTSTNCSDTTSNDSDIDFSDLEEEERRSFFGLDDGSDEDCTAADFWGEPDQTFPSWERVSQLDAHPADLWEPRGELPWQLWPMKTGSRQQAHMVVMVLALATKLPYNTSVRL
ncbi:hypothetical protein Q5P01_014588 [Channa striata]|uniref:Uncharacterized protein n=1 Tax=Channa striata TaxID=64152 RepID=A0AA88MFV9_CHASR|nr:hypothetical protein Q5P01_014588 [Channa striata]